MPISIHNTTRRTIARRRLQHAIALVLEGEGVAVDSVGAVYCGNRMIRRINRDFLGHDYATDTITFTYSEDGPLEGECYISLDVVERNARCYGVPFDNELLRVTIHSALHLAGYPDADPGERSIMQGKEEEYLLALGEHP